MLLYMVTASSADLGSRFYLLLCVGCWVFGVVRLCGCKFLGLWVSVLWVLRVYRVVGLCVCVCVCVFACLRVCACLHAWCLYVILCVIVWL